MDRRKTLLESSHWEQILHAQIQPGVPRKYSPSVFSLLPGFSLSKQIVDLLILLCIIFFPAYQHLSRFGGKVCLPRHRETA